MAIVATKNFVPSDCLEAFQALLRERGFADPVVKNGGVSQMDVDGPYVRTVRVRLTDPSERNRFVNLLEDKSFVNEVVRRAPSVAVQPIGLSNRHGKGSRTRSYIQPMSQIHNTRA